MHRSLWFHKLLGIRSRSARRRQAAQNRRAVRLQLERLEDRVTPTVHTFTAGTVTDLQNDINLANTNGAAGDQYVINLQSGVNFNLNDLTTANKTLDINSKASVQIVGSGNTITPATGQRGFKVESTAEFDNLTISGGKITATAASIGGAAIWDAAGGNLTLNKVTVSGNTVYLPVTPFVSAEGGGIYVNGNANLTIKNSTILDNQALGLDINGDSVLGAGAYGGGIFANGSGTIDISASTISNNTAQAPAGGEARGGGLMVNFDSTANVRLTNVTADGDRAVGSGGTVGGAAAGGAFDIAGGTFALVGSTLKNSSATGGIGVLPPSAVENSYAAGGVSIEGAGGTAFGGGLCVQSGATATVLNSSLLSNTATGGRGDAVGGEAIGGAIDIFAATLNLLNSTLGQNTAQGGDGPQAGSAVGGGLVVSVGGTIPQMFNDTVLFNKAFSGSGTAAATPNGGGGVFAAGLNTITPINTLVQGNTTNGTGPDANATFNVASGNNIFGTTAGIGGTPPGITAPLQTASTLTPGGATSPSYYALLPNAAAINGGTVGTVLNAITNAEFNLGVIPANDPSKAVDEAGQPRSTNGVGLQIDVGAVQFNSSSSTGSLTVSATPSTLTAGSANQDLSVSSKVLDSSGNAVTSGTVTFTLTNSAGQTVGSPLTATVSNGSASGTLVVPSGTGAGNYTVTAHYTGTAIAPPDATTTLTVIQSVSPPPPPTPPPPPPPPPPTQFQAAFAIFIDAIELVFAQHGFPGLPSQADIINSVLGNLKFAGPFGIPAFQAGVTFAEDAFGDH